MAHRVLLGAVQVIPLKSEGPASRGTKLVNRSGRALVFGEERRGEELRGEEKRAEATPAGRPFCPLAMADLKNTAVVMELIVPLPPTTCHRRRCQRAHAGKHG